MTKLANPAYDTARYTQRLCVQTNDVDSSRRVRRRPMMGSSRSAVMRGGCSVIILS